MGRLTALLFGTAVLLGLVLSASVTYAQSGEEEKNAARQRLLTVSKLKCTFTTGTQTDWSGVEGPKTRELPAPRITVELDRIHAPTSSAILRIDGTEN
ncbi:MAG: hypothetical protein ACPGNT_08020, partial [Rhodospirillales bacterium]